MTQQNQKPAQQPRPTAKPVSTQTTKPAPAPARVPAPQTPPTESAMANAALEVGGQQNTQAAAVAPATATPVAAQPVVHAPVSDAYPFNIIMTGHYASGKTLTTVSYLPEGKKYGDPVERIMFDMELRSRMHKSSDGLDHPEKLTFAFKTTMNGKVTGANIYAIMKRTHEDTWVNGRPDMIGVDDIALFQNTLFSYWSDKNAALQTAKLYKKENERCFTQNTWKPNDPGTISTFKDLIGEWLIDMKNWGIVFVGNTKQRNVWQNFGVKGFDEHGDPKMKIEGKSVKMLEVFQQYADAVWTLEREVVLPGTKRKTLKPVPSVKMDLFVPKASIPGIPEQFEWPGWVELWRWHNERVFVGDISKLVAPEAQYSADTIDDIIKDGKNRAVRELKSTCTADEIRYVCSQEWSLSYTYETAKSDELHNEFVQWVKTEVEKLHNQKAQLEEPEAPESPVE